MKTAEKTSSLKLLIGTWSIEGVNLSAAPESPETPVTGIWKVEAMEGGRFLESHWEYDFGSDKHIGISILGTPNSDSRPKIFSFDNGGFHRAYDLDIKGKTWNIQGGQNGPLWNLMKTAVPIKNSGKSSPMVNGGRCAGGRGKSIWTRDNAIWFLKSGHFYGNSSVQVSICLKTLS